MNIELLATFIIFNVINVVIQTVKSIATIRCGKVVAAVINAGAYGLYTYIVVLTMCEIDRWLKCWIVAAANFVGVYVVKMVEEKSRKEKLWKVEATIEKADFESNADLLSVLKVPHNYIDIGKYVILNFYCATCKQSNTVKNLLGEMNAKYFVSESKTL